MLVKDQLIEMQWSSRIMNHFIDRGYTFTHEFDTFYCHPQDLLDSCTKYVRVICDYCGKEYQVQYMTHAKHRNESYQDICHNCRTILQHKRALPARSHRLYTQAIQMCQRFGYTPLFKESDIQSTRSIIQYICPKHGKQHQYVENLIRGHHCVRCSYEHDSPRIASQTFKPDYVESIINSFNGNILLNKQNYVNCNTKLQVQCGKCGQIYQVTLNDYINNHQVQCKSCSMRESRGQERVRRYLESTGVEFQMQKTFSDCKYIRKLRFDFYIPSLNLAIEYDGAQHFGPRGNFTEQDAQIVHTRDEVKNKYCREHSINLLRIPYWDFNNVETVLNKAINSQIEDIV